MSLRKTIEFMILIGFLLSIPATGISLLIRHYDYAIISGLTCIFSLIVFILAYVQRRGEEQKEEKYTHYMGNIGKSPQKLKKLLSSLGDMCALDPELSIKSNAEIILLEKNSLVSKTRLMYSGDEGIVISNKYSISGWGWALLIFLFPLSLIFYLWHSNEEKTRIRDLLAKCL